jgi:hypothetical protein
VTLENGPAPGSEGGAGRDAMTEAGQSVEAAAEGESWLPEAAARDEEPTLVCTTDYGFEVCWRGASGWSLDMPKGEKVERSMAELANHG